MAIVGEDALGELDKKYLKFAIEFEKSMIGQAVRRTIEETLDHGWKLLGILPTAELTRVSRDQVEKYYKPWAE